MAIAQLVRHQQPSTRVTMGPIERSYRRLGFFLNVNYIGEPLSKELKALLRDAYDHRAALQSAIAEAERAIGIEALTS